MKRIYDAPSHEDGLRILVDRLWPRGISQERAALDRWAQSEITPSSQLRSWFAHDPAKFEIFEVRYRAELNERPEAAEFVEEVRTALVASNVTFLYAARDPQINHVVILLAWVNEKLTQGSDT